MLLELLFSLQDQAREKGGRVLLLAGNHEAMRLTGDRRYKPADETQFERAVGVGNLPWVKPDGELEMRPRGSSGAGVVLSNSAGASTSSASKQPPQAGGSADVDPTKLEEQDLKVDAGLTREPEFQHENRPEETIIADPWLNPNGWLQREFRRRYQIFAIVDDNLYLHATISPKYWKEVILPRAEKMGYRGATSSTAPSGGSSPGDATGAAGAPPTTPPPPSAAPVPMPKDIREAVLKAVSAETMEVFFNVKPGEGELVYLQNPLVDAHGPVWSREYVGTLFCGRARPSMWSRE